MRSGNSGSRWGGRSGSDHRRDHGRRGDHHDDRRPPAVTRPVSDDDAVRALLSSASQREREREAERESGRKPRSRPEREPSRDSSSYYGPGGGESSRRDPDGDRRRHRPDRGEDEDEERSRKRRREPDSRWGGSKGDEKEAPAEDSEEKKKPEHKPNFGLSGALTKDSGGGGGGMYKGILLKFQEPPEARAPNTLWRFYVFKGKETLETLHISKQSAYLMGRNQDICDIFMAHPSLSSQHAVLQYRALPVNGRLSCQPYIMDLESTNGTFLNGVRIDAARYYQLKRGDVLTFGASKREYVLLTENSTALR